MAKRDTPILKPLKKAFLKTNLIIINHKQPKHMNKKIFNPRTLKRMMFMLLCLVTLTMFTSCESAEEPEVAIDYYLTIESRVPLKNTMWPRGNMMGQITSRMKQAIHDVYPIPNLQGDDVAVMIACDEAYSYYREAYPAGAQSTECVAKLYRAHMQGKIVKRSVAIKTYSL